MIVVRKLLFTLVLLTFGYTGTVSAFPVTVSYTADNVVNMFYLVETETQDVTFLPVGENYNDWTTPDVLTLDLEYGTSYTLAWRVSNLGEFGEYNPAAFLGEINFGSYSLLTSSDWEYYNGVNWVDTTEYGANDDPTIWVNNFGIVGEIDIDSEWIWSETNFSEGEDSTLIIKNKFVTPVPEPSTLILLGSGFASFVWFSRKRKNV